MIYVFVFYITWSTLHNLFYPIILIIRVFVVVQDVHIYDL